MTFHSIGSTPSILEDGKLKPGIYKIKNIQTETYMDIKVHTREVCCRPAKDLEEGRGFVCWSPLIGGSFLINRSGISDVLELGIRYNS